MSDDEMSDDSMDEELEDSPPKPTKAKAAAKKRKHDDDDDEPAGKKQRRKKDPNKPKGALSAYMCFSQVMRPKLKEQFPELKLPALAQKLGEKWKEMDDHAKKPYNEMAEQDKVRHKKEMASYVPPKDAGGRGKKKAKKVKDPNEPKKPLSAYLIYSNEARPRIAAAFPGMKVGDIAKKIGAEWEAMSDAAKQPYKEQQARLKDKYLVLKAAYAKGGASAAAAAAAKHVDDDDEEEEDEEDESEEEDD